MFIVPESNKSVPFRAVRRSLSNTPPRSTEPAPTVITVPDPLIDPEYRDTHKLPLGLHKSKTPTRTVDELTEAARSTGSPAVKDSGPEPAPEKPSPAPTYPV